MSDITIEGKNLHDIDQTNFQSVGPYTDENEVVEPWQGRNVINGEDQDGRFKLGTYTENDRNFWEFNTINPITRTSQFTDKKLHIVETNVSSNGMVLPKEQKWSVDNYIFTQRNGNNYPLYFYYDKNLHQEEYQATTEGEVNLRFELRESGRSVENYQIDNFLSRDPFRPFLLSGILSGSLLRKDRWQDSVLEGEGFYDKGSTAKIECFPSEFSHFVNWTDPISGEELGEESVYQFTMPLNNVEVVANLMHNTVIKVTPRVEGAPSDGVEVDLRISNQIGDNQPNTNVIPFTPGEVETLSARPGHRLIIAVRPIIPGIGFKGFKILRGSGNEVSFDPYHNTNTGYYISSGGTGPGDPYDGTENITDENAYYGSYFRYFEVAPTQFYEDDGLDELQIFADFGEAFFLILNQNSSFIHNITRVLQRGLGEVRVNGVDQQATQIPIRNENGLTLEAIPDVGYEATTLDGVQLFYTRFPNEDYISGSMFGPAEDGDNDDLNERKQFLLENETTGSITHTFQQQGVFIDVVYNDGVVEQTGPSSDSVIREADSAFEYNMYEPNVEIDIVARNPNSDFPPELTVEVWKGSDNFDSPLTLATEQQLTNHRIGGGQTDDNGNLDFGEIATDGNKTIVKFRTPDVVSTTDVNHAILAGGKRRFYRFTFGALE